jgi:ribonuclease BN (tRNA processing enzyme)
LAKITTIVITHYHPDHYSDLLSLLIRRKVNKITSRLTIVGPKDIKNMTMKAVEMYASDIFATADDVEATGVAFVELIDDSMTVNNYKITARTAKHGKCVPANCYQINQVGFSGDSTSCEGLDEIVKKSSLVFLDSTKNSVADEAHLNFEGVLEYAKRYLDKKFYLAHRGDYDLPELPANVFAPNDGDEVEIGSEKEVK